MNHLPVDPSKPGEYPILLGERLLRKDPVPDKLVQITYNHKTKPTTPRKATITCADPSARFPYNLTIRDKAPNAPQPRTYTYEGSVDPETTLPEPATSKMMLIYDAKQKAFLLEPVSTALHFNLVSAPGQTTAQVTQQHPPLSLLLDSQGSSDNASRDWPDVDPGEAEASNPYDFRHFLPNADKETKPRQQSPPSRATSASLAPSQKSEPSKAPPVPDATKAKTAAPPRSKPAHSRTISNPLRPTKRPPQPSAAGKVPPQPPKPKPAQPDEDEIIIDSAPPVQDSNEPEHQSDSSHLGPAPESNTEENGGNAVDTSSQPQPSTSVGPDILENTAQPSPPHEPSPSSNIIVDGDLIIDMGTPPPPRPGTKIDHSAFGSNSASVDDLEENEEIEGLELPSAVDERDPSPAENGRDQSPAYDEQEPDKMEVDEDDFADGNGDDDLARELEAAFEENARQEAERARQQQQQMIEEEESEVSEEE